MRITLLLLLCVSLLSGGCMAAARRAKREIDRQSAKRKSLDVAPVTWEVRPGHPRMMLSAEEWTLAKRRSVSDPRMELLEKRADKEMRRDRLTYGGGRLLIRSREALQRIPLYAGLWRLTGEKKYARAGTAELLNLCDFPDWEPADPLSTCEMMMSVAIGYDWLHDALTDDERERVVEAIVSKGLQPSLDGYASGGGWTTAPHNWNLVCNGAVIAGSLAILEEEPDIARRTLGLAMRSIRHGMATYEECGGGWPEGPMYHNYATRYAVFAAAAMESSIEKPPRFFGPAFMQTGDYRMAMTGPTGKSFNYGDSNEGVSISPWMMWLGKRFNRTYIDFERKESRDDPSMFDLLWDSESPRTAEPTAETAYFPVVEAGAIRVKGKTDETYIAMKGGSNSPNHSHLDLGTFVLDMQGERWACDLGADNYDLPGYLNTRRDQYLRSSTPGHNTLVIGGVSQPAEGKATLLIDAKQKRAKIVLTDAYPSTTEAVRTFVVRDGAVSIVDEMTLPEPQNIVWHFHTQAQVTVKGNTVALTQNGKTVRMTIRAGKEAKIDVVEDATRPPALPIEGVRDVRIIIPAATRATIDVTLEAVTPRS